MGSAILSSSTRRAHTLRGAVMPEGRSDLDRGERGESEWEGRPGGMLVQRRAWRGDVEVITVRVATGYSWHEVSIGATCTFGEYFRLCKADLNFIRECI